MKAPPAGLAAALLLVCSVNLLAQDPSTSTSALASTSFEKLPIYIIENRDYHPDEVKYYIQGKDKVLFFTKGGVTFRMNGKERDWVVKLEFVDANPDVEPIGEDRQQAVFSYFKGPEKGWKTGIHTFACVKYDNLWPGIDLVYKATSNRLKYEFRVSSGADPDRIHLRYVGGTSTEIIEGGSLEVSTPAGSFMDAAPVAWQDIGGNRLPIDVRYELVDGNAVRLVPGQYDHSRPVVIDPEILVYCGYLGGNLGDSIRGIAVDRNGCAYVAGSTASSAATFPVKAGPDLTHNGRTDAFVAKINAAGTSLEFCGYIGGSDDEYARGISIDNSGNIIVVGDTLSDEKSFPVKSGPDLTHNGSHDVFVAKVNASGTSVVYCGYIGGSSTDRGYAVACDGSGSAYITGYTSSDQKSFPVRIGPDTTYNGNLDAFITKVNMTGTSILFSGYIGGNNQDRGTGLDVDDSGNAYVVGRTQSDQMTFPVKIGPDLTHNAGDDAFVAKVNSSGSSLAYCGYVGGHGSDWGEGLAVDDKGNAFVVGYTYCDESSFPVVIGPDTTHNGGLDAFIAKIKTDGTGFSYCGYLGGNGHDKAYGVDLDRTGNAVVSGVTSSDQTTFPVTGSLDSTYNGSDDSFLAAVDLTGKSLLYCGYVGGASTDCAYCVAVGATGNAFLAGYTASDHGSFPVKVGPFLAIKSITDGFVAKVSRTLLSVDGRPKPGGAVNLSFLSTDDAGLAFQLGSSFGAGPIEIGNKRIGLSIDTLFLISIWGLNPTVFVGYAGILDSKGQAQASIMIPDIPEVVGLDIYSAFVTLKIPDIRSVSNTCSFRITL